MDEHSGIPRPSEGEILPVIIDEAVTEHFPKGSKLKEAKPHGASFWTRTTRIDIELSDNTIQSYFMKLSSGELGMGMLKGEYRGAKTIHKYTPNGIPRPVAWGTYKSDPNTHFYLCEFVDLTKDLPNVHAFSSLLAQLHRNSAEDRDAPSQFGFEVMTYEGTMYQDVRWSATWEELYRRRLLSFIDQEAKSQGPSQELRNLLPDLLDKVIPRLLRPLTTHGRSLKPAALHGDIWYGNLGSNAATGDPMYFDCSVFWGHNEYDLSSMSIARYKMGRHWMEEYHKFIDPSDPKGDYEDRNALYGM
ncbi:Fructosamine/Ketosamine-3-kinase [Nemania sp. FL0031]|nr:Fructosamine/Ketosamine-3-kinase [Nemania sp. FL0031]